MKYLRETIKTIVNLLKNDFSILRTVFFNFHYFSIPVALKLPIFVYKSVRFKKTEGQIILATLPIKTGMIHIGKNHYGFQGKQDYTIWEQIGGKVILELGVHIGQGTFISIGKNGKLKLEQSTHLGGNIRIICRELITIKANSIVGWDVQIIDTDFGETINTITKTKNRMRKPIIIGKNNWLGFGCVFLKGSITPDHCIVKAKSLIDKDFSKAGENIIIGMENKVQVLSKYISWDHSDATEE